MLTCIGCMPKSQCSPLTSEERPDTFLLLCFSYFSWKIEHGIFGEEETGNVVVERFFPLQKRFLTKKAIIAEAWSRSMQSGSGHEQLLKSTANVEKMTLLQTTRSTWLGGKTIIPA